MPSHIGGHSADSGTLLHFILPYTLGPVTFVLYLLPFVLCFLSSVI